MLRKGPLIFLAAALVLAVAATWGAYHWITSQAERAAATRITTAPVVVAAADLSPGQRLEAKDVAVQTWPINTLPQGHYAKPAQVVGRVVRSPIVKGEVMLGAKLAQEGVAGGLSGVVPTGYRAMTVRVDEVIGVAGFVQPGDRVDVLVTVSKGNFATDPATRVVLQNVPVITVGEKIQEETQAGKAKRSKVTVVTLQVKPDEGERLALSATEGKVILALRNQGDAEDPTTQGVHMTSLVPAAQAKTAPTVTTPPPEGPMVEVIRTVDRSVESWDAKADKEAQEQRAARRDKKNDAKLKGALTDAIADRALGGAK